MAARFCGLERVVEDGGGIASLTGLDELDAAALTPDFKLLDGGGAKGVSGAEQNGFALSAEEGCELAAGGGLSGSVDADHEDDFGRGDDGSRRALLLVEDGLELIFQKLLELGSAFDLPAFGAVAQRVENFRCDIDADVGGDEAHLQIFECGFIDDTGERQDAFDAFFQALASARDGLLHAVEYALFRRFFQAAEECLDHALGPLLYSLRDLPSRRLRFARF